jgi:hypothetical protein
MTVKQTGGCFCRTIRYAVSGEPVLQLHCFCADCLAIVGTDGYAGYMVNEDDFLITEGTPLLQAPNIYE